MIRTAVARRPGANIADGLTTVNLGRPDFRLICKQHAAYVAALESFGMSVTVLEADERYPDGCFVEDTAIVTRSSAVMTRSGAPSRRGEGAAIEPLLAPSRTIRRIEPPGCLDGGDVLVMGRRVLVGLSERTNAEGARQLERILATEDLHVETVAVSAGLHLKTDVNCLPPDRLLLTRAYAGRAELAGFEHVVVTDGEEYAANCLFFGEHALVPAGFPETRKQIEQLGFAVLAIDVSEFRKMDGGLSCLSLRF